MHQAQPSVKSPVIRSKFRSSIVAMSLFAVMVTSAQDAKALQLEAAVRGGYSIPSGKLYDADEAKISDSVRAQIPVQLDLGLRFFDLLSLTAYGQFAPAVLAPSLKDDCSALDAKCTAAAFRMGLQAHVHFAGDGDIDPWVGVGVGFESLALSTKIGDNDTTNAYGGFEIPVQAGVDFKLIDMLRIGPVVGYSFGTFGGNIKETCRGDDCDVAEDATEIDSKAAHHFWTFGAKVTLLLL